MQQDLKLKVAIPAKGNFQKISDGEVNRKSKGPFLIQLCHNVRSLNTIYDIPVIPGIEVPIMEFIPPHVVNFQKSSIDRVHVDIDLNWINNASELLMEIDGRRRQHYDSATLITFAKACANKKLNRLHLFLKKDYRWLKRSCILVDIGFGIH